MDSFIPVYKPCLNGMEAIYVNQCLESSWISSKGSFIAKFEKDFSSYLNAQYASSCCNGTVALHLAMLALGLGHNDEVIVPSLTYVASVNTIVQCGAKPVFVDSLKNTWQMDPEDIRRKITTKTRAIVAVHLYGHACGMDELVSICNQHGLYLIEDCAEAIGTRYQGRHVGTFGDVATFSFYGNKTITTGEGGMVIAKEKKIIDRVYHLKTQAVSSVQEYWHDEVGYNYRMTNICAAIGLAQLKSVDQILKNKRQIATWYKNGLKGLPLEFHDESSYTQHSFWMCSILAGDREHRNNLRKFLAQKGIETRPVFNPVHSFPHYKHLQSNESFPIANFLSDCGLNLPSWPELTQDMVEHICTVIRDYFNSLNLSFVKNKENYQA
jgi:perosamine synthetase